MSSQTVYPPQGNNVSSKAIISNATDDNAISVTQTGNADAVVITNSAAQNALVVDQNADAGASVSTGGAVLIENTGNVGAGLVIYSNLGATANGRLCSIKSDNVAFDQRALSVEYEGTTHGVFITNTMGSAGGTNSNALQVSSTNENDTCLGVSGEESGKGTLKVTHTKPASADGNASAISIELAGSGTAAQGIFMDSAGNTTGKLLNLRNNGTELLTLEADGDLKLQTAGQGLYLKEGSNATMGSVALTTGAATVSTTKVTANSRIFLTSQVDGGTPGWLRVSARSAGTSFTITSSSGTDTSTVAWLIIEPA